MEPWAERRVKEGELANKIQKQLSGEKLEGLEEKEIRNIVGNVLHMEHELVTEIGQLPNKEDV